MDLYTRAINSIKGIEFSFCSKDEVQIHSDELRKRD